MFLKTISLSSFRNYFNQEVNLNANKIILVGNNAQGKSNLLEAIELLSTLRSNRSTRDQDLIKENEKKAQIKAQIIRKISDYELGLIIHPKARRTMTVNGENIKRNYNFLGILNTVFFSSLDLYLVRGGPEYRRNWVDNLLIQIEPIYDYILREYYQVLRQRNSFLKQLSDKKNSDLELNLWDQKLAETGSRIIRRRARILERIAPVANLWHGKISNKTENLTINYTPNIFWDRDEPDAVQAAIKAKIEERRKAEFNLGSTIVGPHRDEIEFTINGAPARAYGSQGQQRTLVLALKLAELQLIEQVIGETPLLLLDDVLAELDSQRHNQLLNTLGDRFQTLITTTDLNFFEARLLKQAQILQVEKGQITNF